MEWAENTEAQSETCKKKKLKQFLLPEILSCSDHGHVILQLLQGNLTLLQSPQGAPVGGGGIKRGGRGSDEGQESQVFVEKFGCSCLKIWCSVAC